MAKPVKTVDKVVSAGSWNKHLRRDGRKALMGKVRTELRKELGDLRKNTQ